MLRRKRPDMPRPYRVWGYPLLPALFLLASVALMGNALVTDPRDTGITLLIIAVGIPAYAIWREAHGISAGGGLISLRPGASNTSPSRRRIAT